MKDFFKTFFASIMAVITIALVVLIIVLVVTSKKEKIRDHSYLVIDIYGDVFEYLVYQVQFQNKCDYNPKTKD